MILNNAVRLSLNGEAVVRAVLNDQIVWEVISSPDQFETGKLAAIGVLQANSPSQIDESIAAKANTVLIEVPWDSVHTSADAPLDLTSVNAQIDYAIAKGVNIILRPSAHYTPSWVRTSVPLFVDQNGDTWSSTNTGEQIRDWVWSATGKEYIETFYSQLLQGIGATRRAALYSVQTGFGIYGEVQMPRVNLTSELKW